MYPGVRDDIDHRLLRPLALVEVVRILRPALIIDYSLLVEPWKIPDFVLRGKIAAVPNRTAGDPRPLVDLFEIALMKLQLILFAEIKRFRIFSMEAAFGIGAVFADDGFPMRSLFVLLIHQLAEIFNRSFIPTVVAIAADHVGDVHQRRIHELVLSLNGEPRRILLMGNVM